MKKGFFYSVTLLFILITVFTACKKYDDGPGFSFYSKKARLCNNIWYLEKVLLNDADSTYNWALSHNCLNMDYNSKKPFSDEQTYTFSWYVNDLQHTENGSFKFSDDKKYIIHDAIVAGNDPAIPEYRWRILRLTNSEFWVVD
jgi:hypothetical protein